MRESSSQANPSRRRKRAATSILALLLPAIIALAAAAETRVDQINIDYLLQVFCFVPCSPWTLYTGQEWIPGTNCEKYHNCFLGKPTSWAQCGSGLRFDTFAKHCEAANAVQCPELSTCPPTIMPTLQPSPTPSSQPSEEPTEYPTVSPTIPPDTIARDYIRSKRDAIEKNVLVAYTNAGVAFPSTRYTFDGLMNGLDVIAVRGFGADFKFNLWEGTVNDWKKGLINTAAFLANAMVESISTDSCDENNWQGLNGRYAISNSCGQEGYSYEDEECSLDFESSCPVVSTMEVTAVTSAPGARSPPPFMCKPGSSYAGYWDTNTGMPVKAAYSNSNGRTDVDGCCFWGRGALLTRNVCNLGKLNYYLGKGGANEKRKVLYPDIDFCANPEATCSSPVAEDLRWRTGMFEWSDRVQRYNSDGWDYKDQLLKLVDGDLGYESLLEFITSTSRILSNGCHQRGCAQPNNPEFEIKRLDERIANFDLIVNTILEMKSLLAPKTPKPIAPLPSSPNQTPTFSSPNNKPSPNNYIEQTNPGPNIEQTNPGPTAQLAPPTPPKQPVFFQPPTNSSPNIQSPNTPLVPVKPNPEEAAFDDEYSLIVLDDNGAVHIGLSRLFMATMMITTLHYLML
jgi:hypothetical protein